MKAPVANALRFICHVHVLALCLLAIGGCCDTPHWSELEAQGNELVRAIESYHSAHGEYPASFEAAGLHPRKTRWGDWEYKLNPTEGFFLSVGDYGRDCFELYYSPRVGWTRSS